MFGLNDAVLASSGHLYVITEHHELYGLCTPAQFPIDDERLNAVSKQAH